MTHSRRKMISVVVLFQRWVQMRLIIHTRLHWLSVDASTAPTNKADTFHSNDAICNKSCDAIPSLWSYSNFEYKETVSAIFLEDFLFCFFSAVIFRVQWAVCDEFNDVIRLLPITTIGFALSCRRRFWLEWFSRSSCRFLPACKQTSLWLFSHCLNSCCDTRWFCWKGQHWGDGVYTCSLFARSYYNVAQHLLFWFCVSYRAPDCSYRQGSRVQGRKSQLKVFIRHRRAV